MTTESHEDKWRRLQPAGVGSAGAQNPQAEAHATSGMHHPNYLKVWAILVALLVVSVLGSMSHTRKIVLIAAFGVAVVKAALVAKNFMHVTVEKRWVPYLLVLCLLFIVILFAGVSPDVMRHSGLHWSNPSANQPAQTGAATKHE
jgi:caa(3)-type oxidase subunit IV